MGGRGQWFEHSCENKRKNKKKKQKKRKINRNDQEIEMKPW